MISEQQKMFKINSNQGKANVQFTRRKVISSILLAKLLKIWQHQMVFRMWQLKFSHYCWGWKLVNSFAEQIRQMRYSESCVFPPASLSTLRYITWTAILELQSPLKPLYILKNYLFIWVILNIYCIMNKIVLKLFHLKMNCSMTTIYYYI